MTHEAIAVPEETEVADADENIQTHNFLSLPVIDKANKLVGAVRVDDLLDAALTRAGTGFLNQGAVAGKIAAQVPYFQLPMFRAVRTRLPSPILLFVPQPPPTPLFR